MLTKTIQWYALEPVSAFPVCRYYLRSIGTNPRKEPSQIASSFPELAADLSLPQLFSPDRTFSSVLRISSGTHILCFIW